ncbi:MAG: hypothetical protein Q8P11_02520 [bacterium]|nr:hypothetical protein [bacterium]
METYDPTKFEQEKQRVVNELLKTDIEAEWTEEDAEQHLRISIPFENTASTTSGTELFGHIEKLKDEEKVAGTQDDTLY